MPARSALVRLLTAATLPVLLIVGACAQPAAPPQAAPPAELARFYDQDMAFGPCADYATTALDAQVFTIDPRFECARRVTPATRRSRSVACRHPA